jgi:uncharacterized protein (TIGR02145 family)
MKKITLAFLLLFIIEFAKSQTPESFKYQAVVRDMSGNIIQNQSVGFRISILKGEPTGILEYEESHLLTTNAYGLVNLDIGMGTILFGEFKNINWSASKMFIKLEIDITGGPDYIEMGIFQLVSVPYALHAHTSEKFISITDEVRDTMTNIQVGESFFNLTTSKINYFDGVHWNEVNSTCLPDPTKPIAGSDQFNIAGATTIIQGNTPSIGTGMWLISNGIGGTIKDIYSPTTIFSGLAGSTYTLRWVISNDCGSNSDDVIINFAPFACGSTFKDGRNDEVYNSVLIGNKCWMGENINIGLKVNGIDNMANNSIIEKYCVNNDENNCSEYGGLYQWSEMMQYSSTPGVQGICMQGWHVPTDDEWKILEGTVDSQYGVGDPVWDLEGDRGLDAGGRLKETGTAHWVWPNTGATNIFGFSAFPGGSRNTDASFPGFKIYGRFWTSNTNGANAYRRALSAVSAQVTRDGASKNFGLSVRCVKD